MLINEFPIPLYTTGEKIVFRTLGFTLSTLGSVPSNAFKVPKTTVNTFDGTDPKVDRIKPKVRNTRIFLPCVLSLGKLAVVHCSVLCGGYPIEVLSLRVL